jgi:hypothetical protein
MIARPKKTTDAKVEAVFVKPVVNETEAIVAWLRSPKINMFERNTRWLADRIEEGEHLK